VFEGAEVFSDERLLVAALVSRLTLERWRDECRLVEEPRERQRWLAGHVPRGTRNATAMRFFGTQLLTVRIDGFFGSRGSRILRAQGSDFFRNSGSRILRGILNAKGAQSALAAGVRRDKKKRRAG
jgi:hypothetical protein